ncbi:MAG: cupin [Candidatus Levybacteria bacterium]|nr:cupin [Candidatus Levybacteria bacterium]
MIDLSKFEKTAFDTKPFLKKIAKPWGYELLFTTDNLPYTGKILHVNKGGRLSLQVHDEKQETQMLVNGRCFRIADNAKGELVKEEMQENVGYTNMAGQRHRLEAITDCDIFEVSTPERGMTYRLEDDYSRPDETEDMRKNERT